MKVSVVCVVLMLAVVTMETEGGWVRKTFRKVGDVAKNVVTQEAVKGLTNIIQRVGPGMARGKRSVDWSSMLTQAGGTVAKDLVNELDLACTRFAHLKGKQGLNAQDLTVTLGQTDGNKDGHLNEQELDLFENTVEAVQHCLGLLKRQP